MALYEIKRSLTVRHEGKEFDLPSGPVREIPDNIVNHWFVQYHIKSGSIVPLEVEKPAEVVEQIEDDPVEDNDKPGKRKKR